MKDVLPFIEQIFQNKKELALKKLDKAIKDNKVDIEVLSLIHILNSSANYYSTSSCAGRFVVLSKGSFRGKYSSHFVFKTHSTPIKKELVLDALTKPFEGYLYINLEPPTYHIACRTLDDAIALHQQAIESNIGYSMFKTIKKSIVVEIRGTGMLYIPIGFNDKIFVSDEYVDQVINLSNEILSDEQARMKRFEEKLPLLVNLKE